MSNYVNCMIQPTLVVSNTDISKYLLTSKTILYNFVLISIPVISNYHLKMNRICHRSLMQTKKSQPESKRIMPETRFTEFPALSVDPRVGISRYASETDD